ncbi:MAG: hypothetical protein ACT4OX_08635 [Actinomycetota bacterium]
MLDRVRVEVGPGARIVAANRVRKGGLGGFFAREHYEVIVEKGAGGAHTPGPVAMPTGNGRARVAASILDLAEAVNEEERDTIVLDDEPKSVSTPQSRPSTETAEFAAVLDRITQVADAAAVGASEVPPRPGQRPSALATMVQESLEAAAQTARRGATAARVVEDPAVVEPETMDIDIDIVAETITPPLFRRVARTEEVIERPENALARLGLPARLIPRGTTPKQMQGALIESLSRLPVSPLLPDAPGVVVAVVGHGVQPVLLARELADELDIDPDRVVLATREPLGEGIPAWLQVCDAATAEERRRSWRRRPYPTLVACSVPPGRHQLEWARDILDHLEPTCTWAIVDAGWKCEDVQHWAEVLGGLDVLALNQLDETTSPAAVLDLGIPVGRIEGRPATPVAWAEALCSRLVG